MTADEFACALARHFEGCILHPYQDPAGYWTIGYGERFLRNGETVGPDTAPITQAEAEAMLAERMADLIREIDGMMTVPLSEAQTGAIGDFCWNLGLEAFRFSSLRRQIEIGDNAAITADWLEWDHAHVDGRFVVLPGLRARREAEAHLFTTGELLPGIA